MSPGSSRGLSRLARALAVLLGLAYAGAHFAGAIAFFDNLSNFPVHFAAAFLTGAALFAALKNRPWAIACAAAAALAFAPVVPWYFGPEETPYDATQPFVKFLVSNVDFANDEHETLRQRIADENPDVIGLVEVTSAWVANLQALRAAYPHHLEIPDEHYVGLALYSRLPLADARVLDLGLASTPAIAATLMTEAGEIEIVLAHPMSPVSAEFIDRRNEQLLALAQYIAASGKPVILAGDLNLTMWNDNYSPLAETGGLRNARDGHGVAPTWPAIGLIGVPIDHILATPDIVLRNFRVLGSVGSDHLPISTEFSLR